MDGREFLTVARELAAGPTEAHWRSAVSRAYYAAFLEAREAILRWGAQLPGHQNVHALVRLKFTYSPDRGMRDIGDALDSLLRIRNQADYRLVLPGVFSTNVRSLQSVASASNVIALLDAIEADPARRATAIASLPP